MDPSILYSGGTYEGYAGPHIIAVPRGESQRLVEHPYRTRSMTSILGYINDILTLPFGFKFYTATSNYTPYIS